MTHSFGCFRLIWRKCGATPQQRGNTSHTWLVSLVLNPHKLSITSHTILSCNTHTKTHHTSISLKYYELLGTNGLPRGRGDRTKYLATFGSILSRWCVEKRTMLVLYSSVTLSYLFHICKQSKLSSRTYIV